MSDQLTCQHPKCVEAETGRPAHAATAICSQHWHQLVADLEVIARLWPAFHAQREAWLTFRKPAQPGKAKVLGSPAPGNVAVMSATDPSGSTFAEIHGWAAVLLDTDRQLEPGEAARALSIRSQDIACHPALAEMIPALHASACELAEIVDEHFNTAAQDERPRRVKSCREPDPRDPARACGGSMVWRPGTLVIVCQRCHADEAIDGWLPVSVVCAAFGLAATTVKRWVAQGHVERIDRRVNVDDVRAMVRLRRANGA